MNTWFWNVLDRTRPEERDPRAHAEAITTHLVEHGLETTMSFSEQFDRAIDALYRWDLWGAAYLALGGCSDDSFEYLRCWIIGEGEEAWTLASSIPETYFVSLLDGTGDPEARWHELRLYEGEPLLYAAGTAHQRLTGRWPSTRSQPHPTEPAGREWDEADLPGIFPGLYAVLPERWWEGPSPADTYTNQVFEQATAGVDAVSHGDHDTAAKLLEPLVDDPDLWSVVAQSVGLRIDVAYFAGMGRLLRGDVEGAARALHLLDDDLAEADHVRRALAQVELARGELDEAGRLILDSPDASRMDRVLAAKLVWRRGDQTEAVDRARREIRVKIARDEHPWDVAGSIQQCGRILADAGDVDNAEKAIKVARKLLRRAPGELPLFGHIRLLSASVLRLHGRQAEALRELEPMIETTEGSDLAECHRERARVFIERGRATEAAEDYREAIRVFEDAGERWEAGTTRSEAGLEA